MRIDVEGRIERFWSLLDDKRARFVLFLIYFVMMVSWVSSTYLWGDVDHYWNNINSLIVDGKMPYSGFDFEYPPLTLIVFLIPRVLSPTLDVFHYVFAIFTFIFVLITAHYSYKIADLYGIDRRYSFIIVFMMFIFSTIFIPCRYDIFPAAMTLIGIYYFLVKRYRLAFLIMAVATMIKLYPVLIIMGMSIPFLVKREWKEFVILALICAAVAALSELPFLLDNYHTAFAYLSYHSDRGIQVESLAASILFIIDYFFPDLLYITFNFGSDNIVGPIPDAIASYMNYFMMACVMAFFLWTIFRTARAKVDHERLMAISCIAIEIIVMLFIICGKVYSAQYMIWVAVPIPAVYCIFKENGKRDTLMILTFVFLLLSCYASLFYLKAGFNSDYDVFVFLELIKNISHVGLMVFLIYQIRALTARGNGHD